MELLALFFNSFVVGFSGALMPGPLLAVGIAETPHHGWKTGPVISLGLAIAEIGIVVVLSLGVAAVAQHKAVTGVIGVAGGTALIVMGVMMAYDLLKGRVTYSGQDETTPKSRRRLAGKGITASLSNPYWFVWWATTGLAFLVKSMQFGWIGPVVFYFGHIMSDLVWYSFVSIMLWQGRRLLVGKGLQALILACAVFLVYLGVRFIVDGLS